MDDENGEDGLHWYAVHTHPRQENRVAENLRAWGVNAFNPKLRKPNYNNSRISYVVKPLFTRYIFARFVAHRMLHNIRYTRGVKQVVSFNGIPIPVDDEIVAVIQARVGEDGFIKSEDKLGRGDKVIVRGGMFVNLTGIFEEGVSDSLRVSILLTTINYQAHVKVARELIVKV